MGTIFIFLAGLGLIMVSILGRGNSHLWRNAGIILIVFFVSSEVFFPRLDALLMSGSMNTDTNMITTTPSISIAQYIDEALYNETTGTETRECFRKQARAYCESKKLTTNKVSFPKQGGAGTVSFTCKFASGLSPSLNFTDKEIATCTNQSNQAIDFKTIMIIIGIVSLISIPIQILFRYH